MVPLPMVPLTMVQLTVETTYGTTQCWNHLWHYQVVSFCELIQILTWSVYIIMKMQHSMKPS